MSSEEENPPMHRPTERLCTEQELELLSGNSAACECRTDDHGGSSEKFQKETTFPVRVVLLVCFLLVIVGGIVTAICVPLLSSIYLNNSSTAVEPTSNPLDHYKNKITEQTLLKEHTLIIEVGNSSESVIVTEEEVTVLSDSLVETAFLRQNFSVVFINESLGCYVSKGEEDSSLNAEAARRWKETAGNNVKYERTVYYEENKWPKGWIPNIQSVNQELLDLCPTNRLKYMKKVNNSQAEAIDEASHRDIQERVKRQLEVLPGGPDHPRYQPTNCGSANATMHVCPKKVTKCHVTLKYPCETDCAGDDTTRAAGDEACGRTCGVVPMRVCYTYYSSQNPRIQYCCNPLPPCNPYCGDMRPKITVKMFIRAQNSSFILV